MSRTYNEVPLGLRGDKAMNIEFTPKQYRRMLDLVYIGNWILNSARGADRIPDYDEVESYLFGKCRDFKMPTLSEKINGVDVPSKAFSQGGIHEAIMDYEDSVFYEILAEELAHRDFYISGQTEEVEELAARINAYISEFEKNGISNILVDSDI